MPGNEIDMSQNGHEMDVKWQQDKCKTVMKWVQNTAKWEKNACQETARSRPEMGHNDQKCWEMGHKLIIVHFFYY